MLELERTLTAHTDRGAWRAIAVAALLALAMGCGASEEPASADGSEPAVVDSAPAAQRQARRERAAPPPREPRVPHGPHRALACVSCHQVIPGHDAHRRFACADCHPAPARYASMPLPSPRECQECHHGGTVAAQCTNCHARARIAREVRITTPMRVANWERARTRQLPFDHMWHASLACTDCHAATVDRSPEVECRSCHEPHHRLDAECQQCHSAISQSVHTEAAHRGCGGSGCHVDAVVSAFPPLRSVCLVCHQDMVEHQAPQECAICHAIPETWRGAPGPPGGEP